jgi:hypothetical protein
VEINEAVSRIVLGIMFPQSSAFFLSLPLKKKEEKRIKMNGVCEKAEWNISTDIKTHGTLKRKAGKIAHSVGSSSSSSSNSRDFMSGTIRSV